MNRHHFKRNFNAVDEPLKIIPSKANDDGVKVTGFLKTFQIRDMGRIIWTI